MKGRRRNLFAPLPLVKIRTRSRARMSMSLWNLVNTFRFITFYLPVSYSLRCQNARIRNDSRLIILRNYSASSFKYMGLRFRKPVVRTSLSDLTRSFRRRKKVYGDSRTQRNLDRISTELRDVHSIMTKNINDVISRGEKLESEYLLISVLLR